MSIRGVIVMGFGERARTLPFIVVAAKSFASDVASGVESIALVAVHASGYMEEVSMRKIPAAPMLEYARISEISRDTHAPWTSVLAQRCFAWWKALLRQAQSLPVRLLP